VDGIFLSRASWRLVAASDPAAHLAHPMLDQPPARRAPPAAPAADEQVSVEPEPDHHRTDAGRHDGDEDEL
jgi:hypothetical protein